MKNSQDYNPLHSSDLLFILPIRLFDQGRWKFARIKCDPYGPDLILLSMSVRLVLATDFFIAFFFLFFTEFN